MNPIIEHERRRLAAFMDADEWPDFEVGAQPVAAAAGITLGEAHAHRVGIDVPGGEAWQRKPSWPDDAAHYAMHAMMAQPVHPIVALYLEHLGRWPDEAGLAYWTAEMEHTPLEDLRRLFLAAARDNGE